MDAAFLDSDQNPKTGWCDYDFVLNRSQDGQKISVERNVGNSWAWRKVGHARGQWSRNGIEISVSRALLGVKKGTVALDFKWADNALSAAPTAMDFTLNGDIAPNARFNYRYVAAR